MSSVLACERVGKRFGRLVALESVSLELRPGDFLTLFGRNGAGKSTLLFIVASIIRSYTGGVHLFGEDIRKSPDKTRSAVGLLSHDSFLYNDLTCRENLLFYGKLYRLDRIAERAERMLERVGLGIKSRVAARELSRGMKQRLSLARAFLHEPKLLLLDEPYTGLDEIARETLDSMLHEFVDGEGTVLMTTHDVERGLKMCNRAAILEGGSILRATDAPQFDRNEFREAYHATLSA